MLNFVTPYVGMILDVVLKNLSNSFYVFTLIGDFIDAKSIYRNCPIFSSHKVTHFNLLKVDMLDFYFICGMG